MNPILNNLTPTSSWSPIKQIEFELIFIEFSNIFLPFRITHFRMNLEQISI